MKYYKLIRNPEQYSSYALNKIYPENYTAVDMVCPVRTHYYSFLNQESWIEVPAGEYFVQENKMPEYFAIKRVGDNPLREKYICWLNKEYLTNWSGNIDHCFYGFGKDRITHGACASMKNFGEDGVKLTLEQWDKIINKTTEEEFELQKVWFIELTEENKELVEKWHRKICMIEKTYDIGSFYGVFSDGTGDAWNYNSLPKNTQAITTEQFIKYVLNKEVMKENKKIIGWKLKEDCKQYEKACVSISSLSVYPALRGYYCVRDNNVSICNFKQAGVLELWFEPVYEEEFKVGDWIYIIDTGTSVSCPLSDTGKEHRGAKRYDIVKIEGITFKDGNANVKDPRYYGKNWNLRTESFRLATPEEIKASQTLKFGGYDVTFEKVTSGVRISCNGETGTLSQLEYIYNIVSKKEKMVFGSQEVQLIAYSDNTFWSRDSLKATATFIKIGCTNGTWGEFVAIYEKAKSIL